MPRWKRPAAPEPRARLARPHGPLRPHRALACLLLAAAPAQAVLKGISYGVSPSDTNIPKANNDFMCADASAQWNHSGRGDLAVIGALGANTVRMYGNDPSLHHRGFLDAAHKEGLDVIVGNGDWPYISSPDSCRFHTEYDCSKQIKQSYLQNLKNGFLIEGNVYHPALSYIVAMNEPDVKMPGIEEPMLFCKAVISALDGMLEAEKAANATARPGGALPNFTVTFSWSNCRECSDYRMNPSLGQMFQLRDAMMNPGRYGYKPRNDLADLYRTRFVNSFDTSNAGLRIRRMLLDLYEYEFPTTPVFIAEYRLRSPQGDHQRDVADVLAISESTPLLLGLSCAGFLQLQDQGGTVEPGIFIPGPDVIANMTYFGTEYGIKCLIPAKGEDGTTIPSQIARAYSGAPRLFENSGCITGRGLTTTTTTSSTTVTTTVTVKTSTAAATTSAAPGTTAAVGVPTSLPASTTDAATVPITTSSEAKARTSAAVARDVAGPAPSPAVTSTPGVPPSASTLSSASAPPARLAGSGLAATLLLALVAGAG